MPRTGIRSVHSRLASTVHLHVAGSPNGLAARVATFDLPGINPSATQFLSALRAGMKKGLSASNVRRGAGSRPIHPPRKGAVVHRTIEQVAAPAKAAQPLAADRNVLHPGQTGYDSAGQSVRIIKVDGTRLFVLFVDEDEEDWIDAVDFRPASRR